MNHGNRHDPLEGARTPKAPEALRARTIDAATRALASPRRTMWDALWESRGLRAFWWAATGILVAAHVRITIPDDADAVHRAATARNELERLRHELALPEVEIGPRAAERVLGSSLERTPNDDPAPDPVRPTSRDREVTR